MNLYESVSVMVVLALVCWAVYKVIFSKDTSYMATCINCWHMYWIDLSCAKLKGAFCSPECERAYHEHKERVEREANERLQSMRLRLP